MSFIFYNPNPGGKFVGDCVIRAITKAENISWEQAFVDIVAEAYRLYDMPSSNYIWGSYLKSKGYTRHNLQDTCPDCYTLRMFCDDHKDGIYIVATGTHAVVVMPPGNIYDSWDSSDEIVTYYWKKEEHVNG